MEQAKGRIRSIISNIEDSGLFSSPMVDQELWEVDYTAEQYCGFLQTGNKFIQLAEEEKKRAYNDIIQLADQFGGKIRRPYMTVLYTAKKNIVS